MHRVSHRTKGQESVSGGTGTLWEEEEELTEKDGSLQVMEVKDLPRPTHTPPGTSASPPLRQTPIT